MGQQASEKGRWVCHCPYKKIDNLSIPLNRPVLNPASRRDAATCIATNPKKTQLTFPESIFSHVIALNPNKFS
ncbi:hypothetical protein HUJ05_012858 [Dendroctonus ponderosae]|nr:hypothetical protein HUJ05_012858 [Dendroctonus ponderosae]